MANNHSNFQLPNGWSFAEHHHLNIYATPSPLKCPEMFLNNWNYFWNHEFFGATKLRPQHVRELVRNPSMDDNSHSDYRSMGMMRDGKAVVAHLPNRYDVNMQIHAAFQVFLDWTFDKMDKTNDQKILPLFASIILDPRPTLLHRKEIHLLREQRVQIAMGAYTDAVHVMHVASPLTNIGIAISSIERVKVKVSVKFNLVKVVGSLVNNGANSNVLFDEHTPILIWNVKRAARPSFVENFCNLVGLLDPTLIILLETRVCKAEFDYIHKELGTSMEWTVVEGVGLSNGIAVMWSGAKMNLTVNHVTHGHQAEFHANVKAKPPIAYRRRLYGSA